MRLPYLNETSEKAKKYVVAFRGINYGEGWQEGELEQSHNLSSEKFPCLTPRANRTKVAQYANPTTLHAKGELLVIDGTDVIYNGKTVGAVTAGRKQTATVGNYVIIFPDKKYYNVVTDEFGGMEETFSASNLVFTDSEITGTGFNFKAGDAVTISGCTVAPENNRTLDNAVIIRSATSTKLTFLADTFTASTETGTVTIKRDVPDLDFICESNYRLWGTSGKTIYGSKYADPFNFFYFDTGTADASYWIEVGTDGEFTGCIPYSSHICFFKEDTVHKLYGSKPSNFQISTSKVHGVQAGCERSMCVINEQLIYKGVNGIYSYTGGVPDLISESFGLERYTDAAAACNGERYYVSMKRGEEYSLFCYDVLRNLWLREDSTHALDMTFFEGCVHFINEAGELYRIDGTEDKTGVEWSATFCPFNETMNERKGYSKFHVRLDLDAGAWFAIDIKTDRDTKWRNIFTTYNERAKTISVPIIPTRCDSVSIRLHGKGGCVVRTLIREFSTGSDV